MRDFSHTLPALELCGVSFGYPGAPPVLRDLSVGLPAGRLTALVGPNGCGKSTALKLMARLIAPQAGSVQLGGRPLAGRPTREVARDLALLPQAPIAPEGLTVRELVALGRQPHLTFLGGLRAQDSAAIDVALALTRIETLAGQRVDQLSGGQRQRAFIAMALAQETPVILLDEPTTYLDLRIQIEVMSCLQGIVRGAGRTLVVVLHELNLASAFADHMVMMRAGRVLAEGPPERVMTAETLREVFGLTADVMPDPLTGRPLCLPRMAA